MAGRIDVRVRVNGTLVAQEPLHVGGAGESAETDLAVAVDGRGRAVVSGAGLAGALREWTRRHLRDVESVLWGFQEGDEGHASHLSVADAVIPEAAPEIRQGVGIHRRLGVAAPGFKYDRQILPAGTRFGLRLDLETRQGGAPERDAAALGHLLLALQSGQVRLGAAQTRGHGLVKLTELAIQRQEISSAPGLLDALEKRGEAVTAEQLIAGARLAVRALARVALRIDWQPRGPIMVKAEREGVAADGLPMTTRGQDGKLRLVLPGSGIKGALRSHAERIVRTVLGRRAPESFLDQLELPLIGQVFGARGRRSGPLQPAGGAGRRGALFARDCLHEVPVSPRVWRQVESADDDSGLRLAAERAGVDLQHGYHVAVDRWTGGAADKLLYSSLEPHDARWSPIELSLDVEKLGDSSLPGVALLLLVLRDLGLGRVPLGYATNRGMGAVEVRSVTFDACAGDVLGVLHGLALPGADLTRLPRQVATVLEDAWSTWIEEERSGEVTE